MKCIMVMFDSLNRRYLPPYGCTWTKMPNFSRLTQQTVTFDRAYVGSMPCMPARRELHTARYNFLHRSWGPLEPFDDSMPELLKKRGVYTHLVSDHYHYWEDGGCTYHTRYNSWEISRGQECDPWKGEVAGPVIPETVGGYGRNRQNWVNRKYMQEIEDQSQHKTFSLGLEFMRKNYQADNWFLQIETFDPHEPYFSPKKYKALYPHDYKGRHFDWPPYDKVKETPEEVQHCRYESAALHSMCDDYLGRVLDVMDELDLWKDTMLIVNTDHGFLMAEHGHWAKCRMPFYNEIANMPLFIWDPRSGARKARRQSLVQTIDLPATILDFFGVELSADMQGQPLREVIAHDTPVREAALFGMFGAQVNVTDGRFVYMRAPKAGNAPLYQYTLMPTHMNRRFGLDELRTMTRAESFPFTKGCPVMKLDVSGQALRPDKQKTMLFDLEQDPGQTKPLQVPAQERRMAELLRTLMRANAAPREQYARLGLGD